MRIFVRDWLRLGARPELGGVCAGYNSVMLREPELVGYCLRLTLCATLVDRRAGRLNVWLSAVLRLRALRSKPDHL